MKKITSFLRTIFTKQAATPSILTILLLVSAAPLWAQTVNTVSTGVWYNDGVNAATDGTDYALYCNNTGPEVTGDNNKDRSFVYTPAPKSNRNQNDPWASSALIEYDQPYPSPTAANNYPNHCLGLCAAYTCSNLPVGQTTYSVAFPLQRITFDIFKYYNGQNPKNPDQAPTIRSIDVYPAQDVTEPSKYTCGSYRCSNAGRDDTNESQIAECLGAHWVCDGTTKPVTSTTNVTCAVSYNSDTAELDWYCQDSSKNDYTSYVSCDLDPSQLTDTTVVAICRGGGATKQCTLKGSGAHNPCTINDLQVAQTNGSYCWPTTMTREEACGTGPGKTPTKGTSGGSVVGGQTCWPYADVVWRKSAGICTIQSDADVFRGCCQREGHSDCLVFDNNGAETNEQLNFCTGWDGFYEIAGEFGKSNGQFGFRATAYTNVPSDGVIADRIEIEETGVYPGHNGATQIPIQIDVTNVHTVRSTPSLIGSITPVAAQPYTFTYRLSKDADVRIAIFDASTADNAAYAYDVVPGTNNSTNQASFAAGGDYEAATGVIVRTLVDWQPRTGEGIKGTEKDTQIADFDSWDGRHDEGFLLPAGNYIASIQAKSQDEWDGIDFSRAVTRQVSLDPLKLTDVRVTGLNKQSTAYATISYVPTESATVYWEVYTPGTVFEGPNGVSEILTDSATATGTGPAVKANTGSLVYRHIEQKTRQMNYTDKWDGTCQVSDVTNKALAPATIAKGATFPSGAYESDGVTPKTGTCNEDAGCTYYYHVYQPNVSSCVRYYALHETLPNGTVCTKDNLLYSNATGMCEENYAYGAPMPDGNYVYVLWAEIPYNGKYVNAIGSDDGKPKFTTGATCSKTGKEINNQCFTGVKTLKYTVGTMELERGLVGITLQPVSYATIGSSPTAYGLDPFIFKYSLDRPAQVIATVENTAGVVVKHLTLEEGEPNVSQQLNTITWDGRDDQGRMVYPGTYMFRVKAMDAMFPAQSNEAITTFPVDMYRVVDMETTHVYGDANAKATISYHLSKPMNVQINIYNKDVVIPDYNGLTGEYSDYEVLSVCNGKLEHVAKEDWDKATGRPSVSVDCSDVPSQTMPREIVTNGSIVEYKEYGSPAKYYRKTWTAAEEYNLDPTKYRGDDGKEYSIPKYTIYLKMEQIKTTTQGAGVVWPPRICDKKTDGTDRGTESIFTGGAVDPAKVNQYKVACIYVNDKTFTNYPANAVTAASGAVDVRVQPIHTIERSSLKTGDEALVMEEWDALYFYNPTPSGSKYTQEQINKCKNATEKANCPYGMIPDGAYPFYISARSNEPFNRYYYSRQMDGVSNVYSVSDQPFRTAAEVKQESYLYASDKSVGNIYVTRGAVYFLDDSVHVYSNSPQMFNTSTTTMKYLPPYEINFSISRAATVEIAIVALQDGVCSPITDNVKSGKVNTFESRTNVAGDICRVLSYKPKNMSSQAFDATAIHKVIWDGTDHNGNYVKSGINYEIRLTARNYPDATMYEPTVKSITTTVNIMKVFDLLEVDNYAIFQRDTDMKIGYQVSVPMKVAVQILKPGTTIYDWTKGTLRDPATGKEVKDINDVLVRAIVGIRSSNMLIQEVWDGRDYAQQEVPDGVYPFRFVTVPGNETAAIDSVTGAIAEGFGDDSSEDSTKWKVNYVADDQEYTTLHKATVAIGDGRFVCEDWKKTVFFYPNPLRDASKGTLEITKMPVPGTVSIKYFNLAGDLVRDSDYTCVDANNFQTTMGKDFYFQPDNNISDTRVPLDENGDLAIKNIRNAALRCKWDRTNQHGKKVARGVYFGLIDFKAFNGREHCQKVVKILIP